MENYYPRWVELPEVGDVVSLVNAEGQEAIGLVFSVRAADRVASIAYLLGKPPGVNIKISGLTSIGL